MDKNVFQRTSTPSPQIYKNRKTELQTTVWAGRRWGGRACGNTVQQKGWGSRLDSRCSAPFLPQGVPSTKGKTSHWQRNSREIPALLCSALHVRAAELKHKADRDGAVITCKTLNSWNRKAHGTNPTQCLSDQGLKLNCNSDLCHLHTLKPVRPGNTRCLLCYSASHMLQKEN